VGRPQNFLLGVAIVNLTTVCITVWAPVPLPDRLVLDQ
jgi:hypothetical protein